MRQLFLYVFTGFFFAVLPVLAQVDTSTFNIRVYGGTDATPPTTPTLLSVTPVASTQIDVSWSSSTDNFAVAGYSVLRDGEAIATTTLLSYSDTGLLASTTYSYAVRAFDVAINYSTTSNSLATTTPNGPPPPEETGGESHESTAARVVIDDLYTESGVSTTSLFVHTARPARFEIRWGRTGSYELGYVVSSVYSTEHVITLTELEPSTRYEYEVIGYTLHGVQSVVQTGHFTTLSNLQKNISPANVARFTAVKNGQSVDLSWVTPTQDTFSHVRIVRSHLGFPSHPQNGAIVYQGTGNAVTDTDILSQYSPVYYTAFVYDVYGNVSSGAIAMVSGEGDSPAERTPENDEGTKIPLVTEATSHVDEDRITADMKMPQPSDIAISQGEDTFTLLDSDIQLRSEEAFLVSVPYTAVAGNLKSIILTILDPTNNRKSYSFLLRINHDQTAYEATITPLRVVGRSQITLEIYDYEAFVVATYRTPLILGGPDFSAEGSTPSSLLDKHPLLFFSIWFAAIFCLVIWLLIFLYRRRGEDKE